MPQVVMLSGGVGGARAARGFAAALAPDELTVVTNVGDDDLMHGVLVCADLDTVTYTLAGVEGPFGWGRDGDTFTVMDELARLGVDTTFRLGDLDLALCLQRSAALGAGQPLSTVTAQITQSFGVAHRVVPATDQAVRTKLRTTAGEWLAFQEYFVIRRHEDEIAEVIFDGAEAAMAAPGVVDAIAAAEVVVIAPSNPVLSVWPILAVDEISDAVADADRVIAVSPLFGGKALKGPADTIMASLGLLPGTAGVLEAYRGLLSDLVIDVGDAADAGIETDVRIHVLDTRVGTPEQSERFARELLAL